jgi:hypothetical protein
MRFAALQMRRKLLEIAEQEIGGVTTRLSWEADMTFPEIYSEENSTLVRDQRNAEAS